MPKILTNPTQDELLSTFVENMNCLIHPDLPGAEVSQDPDFIWFYSGVPFPIFNPVYRLRVAEEEVEQKIADVTAFFKQKGVPWAWYIFPGNQPPNLGDYLVKAGMVKVDEAPGMVLELDRLPLDLTLPEGVTIKKVTTAEDQRLFCQTLTSGYGLPDFTIEPLEKMIRPSEELINYLAFVGGVPVATSTLLLKAGVAGIYDVSTLPEYRNRGIGTAISTAPLLDARGQGYRLAILDSSQDGFPIYIRLGFKEVCRVPVYMPGETNESQRII